MADVDIEELIKRHNSHRGAVTMTAVQPAGRFGVIEQDGQGMVTKFLEKPPGDRAWVNGGFFVCKPEVFDYIDGDLTSFEEEPLSKLADNNQLIAFKHSGFWQPMDTLRDKKNLCKLWDSEKAPWKKW